MGPINTPRNFSISSGLPFLCALHYLLSGPEVQGLSTKYTLGLSTMQRALLCPLSAQQSLQGFRASTSKRGDFGRVGNEADFNEQLITREFSLQVGFFLDVFQFPAIDPFAIDPEGLLRRPGQLGKAVP